MRICFETHVEDWAAMQTYAAERLKPLKKHVRKSRIRLLILILLIAGVIYLADGLGGMLSFLAVFGVVWVFLSLIGFGRKPKRIFKELCSIYRSAFENRPDMRLFWDVTETQLTITDDETQTIIPWSSIHQVILLPQFMFVQYGTLGWAYLPKRLFLEGDCLTFTHHFLTLYRKYAYDHGASPNIAQDESEFKLAGAKKNL